MSRRIRARSERIRGHGASADADSPPPGEEVA